MQKVPLYVVFFECATKCTAFLHFTFLCQILLLRSLVLDHTHLVLLAIFSVVNLDIILEIKSSW